MKFIYFLLMFLLFISCKKKENSNWTIEVPAISSSSSPQCIDLNDDDILDIVMGAGGLEWSKTKMGVVAIDGANGELIWSVPANNQIVGSAVFQELSGDQTPDVIIGGRSAELFAINGKNGEVIWRFLDVQKNNTTGWYNFYNPQIVEDQDNDNFKDILICNGGDATIPASVKNRPIGKIMLISGKTGEIIAQDEMPDLRETYFTPVLFGDDINPDIVFGSGGETWPGHLYLCKLSDVLNNSISKNAIVLDSSNKKGYIAPPILADLNNDKQLDIIFNTAEGKTKLIDGKSKKMIWEVSKDSSEVFSQPAVGYFLGKDAYLDVFVNYAIGTFPEYSHAVQYLINGKTGKIEKTFKSKSFTYSSPLTADIDNDGVDEVIFTDNEEKLIENKTKPYYQIFVRDFAKNKKYAISKPINGACFASTPFLGDLDKDGKLDLVFSGSPAITLYFPGNTTFEKAAMNLQVHREKLVHINAKNTRWGNYLGKESKSRMY